MKVEEDELLDPEALRGIDPEVEFEGYTGNEGMTLERWYRHAAILLWPTRRHFEVLCDRDGRNAVPELERMVRQWQGSEPGEAAALKSQCIDLARAILTTWSEERYGLPHSEKSKTEGLLETLATLGDPTLIGGFLGDLMVKDVTIEPGKALVAVCETHGWKTFEKELRAVMDATSRNTMERNVRLLEQICSARPRKKAGWGELCTTLSEALVAAVERADRGPSQDDWRTRRVDRGEVLAGLARSLILTGGGDLLSRVVAHALAEPKTYPLTSAHMPALATLRPWLAKNAKKPLPALTTWLSACREQLESLTAKAPEATEDLSTGGQDRLHLPGLCRAEAVLQGPGRVVPPIPHEAGSARPPREPDPQSQVRPGPQDRNAGLSAYLDLHQEHGVVPGKDEGIPSEPGASGDRPGHRKSPSEMIGDSILPPLPPRPGRREGSMGVRGFGPPLIESQ